jgi:hypothetical protein
MADEIKPLLPAEPIFRRDDDVLALQAADLYAGLVRSRKGEKNAAREAILSPLLAAFSATKVKGIADIRAQASVALSAWEQAFNAIGFAAATDFIPIVDKLKGTLADIGGDPVSERTLAPRHVEHVGVREDDDSDGFAWLRRELAEVTAISARSYVVGRDTLSNPPTSAGLSIPDERLNRAIALLDEDSLDAYRRKVAKNRARAARKAGARSPQRRR